jgi:BirA family biotin operon repressor/biotin-[acetyl-CoA-carboxylase] ligase
MAVKDRVLRELEYNRGEYISGEDLANSLGVSRNSIWKSVKNLQEQGYEILGVPNKGYLLKENSDIISAQGIEKYLGSLVKVFDIEVHKKVSSTNDLIKDSKGIEGKVIVAEEQTGGKGRLGRSFYSPKESGVYFSLLLTPTIPIDEATAITAAAAVAVAEAMEKMTGQDVQIKWVNDIYLNGKKVCGILTEGIFDMENRRLGQVILGIGINLTEPQEGFPIDLSPSAGCVFREGTTPKDGRNLIVAEVLMHFWTYYKNLQSKSFLAGYRKRSMVTGRDILILRGQELPRKAKALDIDDNFHLIVEGEDGTIENLSSGEVSVRPIDY